MGSDPIKSKQITKQTNNMITITIKLVLFMIYVLSGITLFISFFNTATIYSYKNYIYVINIILFLLSLYLWFIYSCSAPCNEEIFLFSFLSNLYFDVYLDNLSIFFILLTTFLTGLVLLLGSMNVKYRLKEYFFYFFLLQFFIINFFLVRNLFFFYIFFEAVLIPMFLIIIIWGSRKRKIHASFVFFFFTFVGSLFMLLGVIWIWLNYNTLDIIYLNNYIAFYWLDQYYLWLLFFIAFAVKVPIFPFHTWLPEAHVEAPTGGSILLAGILLKLGLYGIIRILLPFFPLGNIYYSPFVWVISFISIIYISLIIIQQVDLKKIIAYSSIAHMNFAILGIFVFNEYGMEGAIFTMLSHGLISSMLFFCIGILYDRYGERNLLYYSNLVQLMPKFSLIFFFALIANMGIPGMSSFIGEFLLLLSLSFKSYFLLFILSLSLFLTTIYCIWLYNRLSFGFMNFWFITKYKDLTNLEYFIAIIFIICILIFGIYPNCIFDITQDLDLFNNIAYCDEDYIQNDLAFYRKLFNLETVDDMNKFIFDLLERNDVDIYQQILNLETADNIDKFVLDLLIPDSGFVIVKIHSDLHFFYVNDLLSKGYENLSEGERRMLWELLYISRLSGEELDEYAKWVAIQMEYYFWKNLACK